MEAISEIEALRQEVKTLRLEVEALHQKLKKYKAEENVDIFGDFCELLWENDEYKDFIYQHRRLFLEVFDRRTFLSYAVCKNRIDVVRDILKLSKEESDDFLKEVVSPPLNKTPLHIAAGSGYIDIVKILVLYGNANVNEKTRDEYECSALHCAIWPGGDYNLDVVKFLIEQGADLFAVDVRYINLLHLTIKLDTPDIAELLMEKAPGLLTAEGQGDMPTAKEYAKEKYNDSYTATVLTDNYDV